MGGHGCYGCAWCLLPIGVPRAMGAIAYWYVYLRYLELWCAKELRGLWVYYTLCVMHVMSMCI